MRIVLDAMGSDAGATPLVEGAVTAAKRLGCDILLTGKQHTLKRFLRHFHYTGSHIEVAPCSQTVGMGDNPTDSLQLRDSSIAVAARLVREGQADALVSAGNTGATLAHCLTSWGRLKGINRPGIATLMPTPRHPCLLLDVGANVDCKPKNLVDFALMGSVYAREILGRSNPKVGLLSVGAERTKGNALTLCAYALLESSHLNFVGNIEGEQFFAGEVDVLVCDGFVGNVVLKACEAAAKMIMGGVKGAMKKNVFSLAGALLLAPSIRRFRKTIDQSEYGGAPLLGLRGICIIGHGASSPKAVANAIRVATEAVRHNLNEKISAEAERVSEDIGDASAAAAQG
ncbi:MAG TPA: phosphate acyltransferase PlsX [Sumerlaeia bacterium]|nr:phosphate acyltransferase PlsX [Sumerlaeia bacterium]